MEKRPSPPRDSSIMTSPTQTALGLGAFIRCQMSDIRCRISEAGRGVTGRPLTSDICDLISVSRLHADDRGAVVAADPECDRGRGVVDEHVPHIGVARQRVLDALAALG